MAVIPAAAASADTATPTPSPSPSASSGGSGTDLSGNVTFGIGPATKGIIDRRLNFNYLQARLGSVSDQVGVVNLSTQPLTLNLYPADALNQTDGVLGLQPRNVKPQDLASWITLKTPTGKAYVVVPPRTTIYVPFTVKVPNKALIGDHLAGIVASIVAAGQTPGDLSTNVAFEQRVGVRVAMRVAGQLHPELKIENLTAHYVGSTNPLSAGSSVVTYTVRNTGNVRLGASQSVRVHGFFGPDAQSTGVPDIALLLPGGSATVTVNVPGVWPLVYLQADVTLIPLSPPTEANPQIGVFTASTSFWAIPWVVLAILLILILLLLWWLRRRRATPPPAAGRRERGRDTDLVTSTTASPTAQE
jgi:hypothetical protein